MSLSSLNQRKQVAACRLSKKKNNTCALIRLGWDTFHVSALLCHSTPTIHRSYSTPFDGIHPPAIRRHPPLDTIRRHSTPSTTRHHSTPFHAKYHQPTSYIARCPFSSTAIHQLVLQQCSLVHPSLSYEPCWASQFSWREWLVHTIHSNFRSTPNGASVGICVRVRSVEPSSHPITFQLSTFKFSFKSRPPKLSIARLPVPFVLEALSPAAMSTSTPAVKRHRPAISTTVP